MSTTKTTQQLARELSGLLEISDSLNGATIVSLIYRSKEGSICRKNFDRESSPAGAINAIKAEIDKEAASIKKALQEALANE